MTLPSERPSQRARAARVTRRPPGFAATVVAFVIVFAIAWMFFVRSGSSVPTPTSQGVRGTFSWAREAGGPTTAGSFSAATDGDAGGSLRPDAGTQAATPVQSVYDARSRTETTVGGRGPTSATRTVGDWPPVWRVATHSPLDYQGLAAVVRAAVEDGDDDIGIKPLRQGDRAVWRAAMTMDGELIDLVVDQQTGIVTWYNDGKATFVADVQWASPPPASATYSVAVPAGTPVRNERKKEYTYAASPAEAGRTAGFDPLVSDLAPDGYARRAVATIDDASRPLTWLETEKRDLPVAPSSDEPVVAQLYTRGLSWFTMEQSGPRWTRAYGRALDDLLRPESGPRLSYEETTLQYGAFKGETAATWYQKSGPSLFVQAANGAVFVTGSLTRQELIAFAEGLKPVPAAR